MCLPTLEKLITSSSAVPQVPTWVSSLRNLQQLCIEVEAVKQDDLCILGALPTLLILDLHGTPKSKDRLTVNGEVGFRCLRKFHYSIPYEGMNLMFAAGSMPELGKLEIDFDANETEFTTSGGGFDFGIENLPCLIALTCKVSSISFEAAKAAIERAARTHPNHPTLLFSYY